MLIKYIKRSKLERRLLSQRNTKYEPRYFQLHILICQGGLNIYGLNTYTVEHLFYLY